MIRAIGSRFGRLSIRWRLAAVSAGLTLVILVVFAIVVGRMVTDRLNADFNEELQTAANQLALEIPLGQQNLDPQALATEARVFKLVTADGQTFQDVATPGAPNFGPPTSSVKDFEELRVASAGPIPTNSLQFPPLYVQYARTTTGLETTIHRLWLFLGVGVLAGTVLAALAGVAIARRAMRPISSLTAAAGEIASTRDPSRRLPQPETNDEVAELAHTLDQMLRALDEARSETQQMVVAQREFVADASHELRTPLTSILANLELLEATLSAEEVQRDERGEMVESALRSSRRMSRLVSDLLLLARADAGRSAPRRRVELPEITGAAVAEAMPVADRHPISADLPDSAPVVGNPDELHRLVANLIDNAVRHTPEGTPIHVKVATDDGSALLEVTDEGPGLPADLGDQIFERFVRGSGPADLSRNAGSGLGLAIVHAVATSHGGTVVAGSSEAGGARFTVRVPLATSSPAPQQGALRTEPSS